MLEFEARGGRIGLGGEVYGWEEEVVVEDGSAWNVEDVVINL